LSSRPGVNDPLQTISILLFDSPERPSAVRLINAFTTRNEPLPIAGLGLHRPLQLEYFLSQRLPPEQAALINREPNSPRAKLERMVLAHYPASARLETIIALLNVDPNVLSVALMSSGENENTPPPPPAPPGPLPANNQAEQNNLAEAWALSPGHATIGVIDMGIDAPIVAGSALAHPELRAFTRNGGVSTFTGGNWLEALSFDLSLRDANGVRVVYPIVDEAGFHGQSVSAACTAANRVLKVGHGTHVAGLIASNHGYITPATDPKGSCVQCGLQIWKTTKTKCDDQTVPAEAIPDLTNAAADLINTRENWWQGIVNGRRRHRRSCGPTQLRDTFRALGKLCKPTSASPANGDLVQWNKWRCGRICFHHAELPRAGFEKERHVDADLSDAKVNPGSQREQRHGSQHCCGRGGFSAARRAGLPVSRADGLHLAAMQQ